MGRRSSSSTWARPRPWTSSTRTGSSWAARSLPGLALAADALAEGTAKLPRVELGLPEEAIGADTSSALQSGIVIGHVGAVRELVTRMRPDLGEHPARSCRAAPAQGGPRGSCHRHRRPLRRGVGARRPGRGRGPRAAAVADELDPELVLRGLGLLAERLATLPGAGPLVSEEATAGLGRSAGSAARRTAAGPLEGRLVLLGVTGSIAAYKAAELVRLLAAAGAEVQVMMSRAATQFIGPLTLETLSGRPVMLDPLELQSDRRIGHIVAADSADAILVAPATARWLAAMAARARRRRHHGHLPGQQRAGRRRAGHGWRDVRASRHPRQRRSGCGSSATASSSPAAGPLASGQVGVGRLAELPRLVDAVADVVRGTPVRQPDPSLRPPRASAGRPARPAPAGTSSSAPAARRSPSTRSASSAIARAAAWASPSRRRRSCAGRA